MQKITLCKLDQIEANLLNLTNQREDSKITYEEASRE